MTGLPVTNITTQAVTYVAIDSTGAVIQSSTPFWNSLSRQYIALGRLGHGNFTNIVGVRDLVNAAFDPIGRLGDLMTSLGTFNISGNEYSAASTDLTIAKSSGSTFSLGVNFSVDKKSPDISQDMTAMPVTFLYSRRNGTGGFALGSVTTLVDPNNYDDGTGTLAAVPAGYWTVQNIIFIPGSTANHRIEYGQQTFATYALALSGGAPDSHFIHNPNFGLGTIRTFLIVQQGATNLSLNTSAAFIQNGKFGSGSGSGSSGGGNVVVGAPSDASYIVMSSDTTLTNEKVIGSDFFITNAHVATLAGILESKLSLNFPTHSNVNDPTAGQAAALVGTFGTPASTNRYVTDSDPRNTNTRTPSPHEVINATALGATQTISGGVAGYVFKATGPTTAQLIQLSHSELINVGTNTHTQIDSFIASAGMMNGLATLDPSSKVPTSQISEVLAITDLTSYATTSGTGTTAILSTITTPAIGQVLSWNGTDWTNQTLPPQLSDSGTNGIVVRTALNTTVSRTLVAPAAGFTITDSNGTIGNPTFVLSNDLGAIESLNGTGLYARTGVDTWAALSIIGTANQITITNGNGVGGNPTALIANNPILPGTGSVTIPSGSSTQRPVTPTAGMLRFNTTSLVPETYNGTSWLTLANSGTVTSVAANGGTTGLNFSGSPIISSGTLTLSGTLATTNGGTGITSMGTANQVLGVNTAGNGLEYKNIVAGDGVSVTPTTNNVTVALANGYGQGGSVYRAWSGNIISQSGNTRIVVGTAVPTITEGTQLWSQTITPGSVNANFIINSAMSVAASNNNTHTAALFRTVNGVSTYIGGVIQTMYSGNSEGVGFVITDVPGTTSPVTYSVQYGTTGNVWYINRRTNENTYGGVQSGWSIQEV